MGVEVRVRILMGRGGRERVEGRSWVSIFFFLILFWVTDGWMKRLKGDRGYMYTVL